MIPSDFDQLYNSVVAKAIKGWELVLDKNWIKVINSNLLFKREIYWDNLSIKSINGKLVIKAGGKTQNFQIALILTLNYNN